MRDLCSAFEHGYISMDDNTDTYDDISSLDIAAAIGLAETMMDDQLVPEDTLGLFDDLSTPEEYQERVPLRDRKRKMPAFEQYVLERCNIKR